MQIRRSLLMRALAVVLAVFMALSGCLFVLLYHSTRSTVREQELQNVATRLEMVCAYLNLALDNARNTVYQFMRSNLMTSEDTETIQQFFRSYSETNGVAGVKLLLEGDEVLAIDQPMLLSSMQVQGGRLRLRQGRGGALALDHDLRVVVPDAASDRRVDLLHAPDAGRPGSA